MIRTIFLTAASPRIGGGHVLRCLALAEGLQKHGIDPVFAVDKVTVSTVGLLRSSPFRIIEVTDAMDRSLIGAVGDVVVFDGYDLDEAVERRWRGISIRVVIDDLADRRHDCEVLVDHSPGRLRAHYSTLVPSECELLVGPSFALLRPEFRQLRGQALARRSRAVIPRRILVAMGLTDLEGITRRVVEGALKAGRGLEFDVVTGRGAISLPWLHAMADRLPLKVHVDLDAKGMAHLMARADIAIGGGGGTSLERCCMGLPSLVVLLVENQRLIAESLERLGAIRVVGDLAEVTPERIAEALAAFVDDEGKARECARIAASIVDGRGADKVCQVILEKLSQASGNVVIR